MVNRRWSTDVDDRHYELEIKNGHVSVTSVAPPEYHTMQSAYCTVAEFVAGQISADLRQIFGDSALAEALAAAGKA